MYKLFLKKNCPFSEIVEIYLLLSGGNNYEVSWDNNSDIKKYPCLFFNDRFLYESRSIINHMSGYKCANDQFFSSWDDVVDNWKKELTGECFSKENIYIHDFFEGDFSNENMAMVLPHLVRMKYSFHVSVVARGVIGTELLSRIQEKCSSVFSDIEKIIISKKDFLRVLIRNFDFPSKDFYGVVSDRIYLDSAASSLPSKLAIEKRNDLLDYYASTHSEVSLYSKKLGELVESTRLEVLDFINLSADGYTTLFIGHGATSCSNYLASILDDGATALSIAEHHSSDLPYRKLGKIFRFDLNQEEFFNKYKALERLLEKEDISYIVTTATSNVTGHMPDLYEIDRLAVRFGANLIVDASQAIAHIKLDFSVFTSLIAVYFSSHKVYAPGGPGVLVVKMSVLENAPPTILGGGAVSDVNADGFSLLSNITAAHQPGTIDALAVVELSGALEHLKKMKKSGLDNYESLLIQYVKESFRDYSNIYIYNEEADNTGLLSFNIKGEDHSSIARILYERSNIEVRNACFCAHHYVRYLLRKHFITKSSSDLYEYTGMVRISIGPYTKIEHLDQFMKVVIDMASEKL